MASGISTKLVPLWAEMGHYILLMFSCPNIRWVHYFKIYLNREYSIGILTVLINTYGHSMAAFPLLLEIFPGHETDQWTPIRFI